MRREMFYRPETSSRNNKEIYPILKNLDLKINKIERQPFQRCFINIDTQSFSIVRVKYYISIL